MRSASQLSYLEALGIPVWVNKGPAAVLEESIPELCLGPGTGGCLLLCGDAAEASSRLAADVTRALPEQPVWGWPAGDKPGLSPATAVDERLFTTVLVFGKLLAASLLGRETPDMIGPARLLLAPTLNDLAGDAGARRKLWKTLCENGLVAAP